MAHAGDFDLESAMFDKGGIHAAVITHISESNRTPNMMTVGAGGYAAHDFAISPNGLVVVQERLRVLERKLDKAFGQSLLPKSQQRAAP